MYVRKESREHGVADAIMASLTAEAKNAALPVLRLETGSHQTAAIRFYRRHGFEPCEVFEPYASMTMEATTTSVFLEKHLDAIPIACTLTPKAYAGRIAWIAELNRALLRSYRREDLILELEYAPEAAAQVRAQVRALVQQEEKCCAFLRFTLHEASDAIRLLIEAPPDAHDSADALFAPFLDHAPPSPRMP